MGNFIPQVQQRLLTNHLGTNLAFRLVGHHVVREILGTFRESLDKSGRQIFQPITRFRTDGHNGIIGKICKGSHQGEKLLPRQQVNLVECQQLRYFLLGHFLDDCPILLPYLGGIHKHQHPIHAVHGILHGLHHVLP